MFRQAVTKLVFLAVCCLLMFGTGSCGSSQEGDPRQETIAWLDGVRDRKKEEIQEHFRNLQRTAQSIVRDELMMKHFHDLLVDDQAAGARRTLNPVASHELDAHFVGRYGNFYDLLFVERGGYIFHSIKQESDHHSNLFSGRLRDTPLAHSMRNNPEVQFVDFEAYGPSGEAAAFFVVPVKVEDAVQGWFLLQYASNELNSMLGDRKEMGRTGEVYLVNKNRQMLSDSRFVNDTTVLDLVIDTEAVRRAFAEGEGHTLTTDYRGRPVFSSYAAFEFLNTHWAIIAEIDEDEILSRFFRSHSDRLAAELATRAGLKTKALSQPGALGGQLDNAWRVDMGELRRVSEGQICWTPGVGPCTAVAAFRPGKFGYLLHLGPTDDVYQDDPLTRTFLGSRRTRHLTELVARISGFEVVTSELSQVQFVIVATHANSLKGILNTLLDQGIGLSQIKFLYQTDADFANVRFDQAAGSVLCEWVSIGHPARLAHFAAERQTDLGTLLKENLGYLNSQ